jgi:hypothetical protein
MDLPTKMATLTAVLAFFVIGFALNHIDKKWPNK